MSEPRIERAGEQVVIVFDEDLTSSTVLDVRPRLTELIASGVRRVVFDFSRTEFVDSSGIGMMISAHNSVTKLGGGIEVTGASPEVLTLFRAMRLDKRFPVKGA